MDIASKAAINILLAIEVGYKAAEAGKSLEATLDYARKNLLEISETPSTPSAVSAAFPSSHLG